MCPLPLLLLTLTLALPAAAQPNRPNVLWLIAEDFGPHLGCYGTKEVHTPHLDQLAKDGVRFTRAYTTAPVCSPSRSAFMTGMYQTTIGAHNHRSHRGDGHALPDGVRLLTHVLRDAGYTTANVRQLPPPIGFKGSGKTDWNFAPGPKPFDTDAWADLKTKQPFYAQLNFGETHRAFTGAKRADPAKIDLPPYYPDHPVARADYARYLDAASELDRKIGLVLKQLETDGLADDTIVFFFGDNGEANVRGKQFCYEEGLHVPLIVRWPKNVPAPKQIKPGTVDDRLIEMIDLHPTVIDLAGGEIPPKTQGRIFLGDHAAEPRQFAFGARDRCDETVFRLRTVRDDRYRYIRNFTPDRPFLQPNAYKARQYPVWTLLPELDAQGKLTPAQKALTAPTMPEEELYDLQADPWQITNLATAPAHQATRQKLRAALDQWIEQTNDQGRTFETPETITRETAPRPNARNRPRN